jgi:hypothetical protein
LTNGTVTVLDPPAPATNCGASAGETDGAAGTATFDYQEPVMGYDAATNMVYVLDFTGSSACSIGTPGACTTGLVRRITANGTVSTVATFGTGNNVGMAGQLPFPNARQVVQAYVAANNSLVYIPDNFTGILEVRL